MSRDAAQITISWRPTKKQWKALNWKPKPTGDGAPVGILAVLGWYASGKTTCAAMRTLIHAANTGWTPDYGGDRPRLVAMHPTSRGVRETLLPTYEKVCPPELILKKWGQPFPRWRLINGTEIVFMSGESAAIEGMTVCGLHIDEISHPVFADPTKWSNFIARCRDPNAAELLIVVSGLPELGFVSDTFRLDALEPHQRVNRETILIGTQDNPHIPPEMFKQVLATCPAGYEDALLRGGWLPGANQLYTQFDESIHIVPDTRASKTAPCDLALDLGQNAAAVIGQETSVKTARGTERGILVVHDVRTHRVGLEGLIELVKSCPYGHQIVAGHSKIATDPRISIDEMNMLRRAFPGVHVLKRPPTDPLYQVEPGIRLVQAHLRNAGGESRLFFCESLKRTKNGVIDAMRGTQTNPQTGKRKKADALDHGEDALRYLVCMMNKVPVQPTAKGVMHGL